MFENEVTIPRLTAHIKRRGRVRFRFLSFISSDAFFIVIAGRAIVEGLRYFKDGDLLLVFIVNSLLRASTKLLFAKRREVRTRWVKYIRAETSLD